MIFPKKTVQWLVEFDQRLHVDNAIFHVHMVGIKHFEINFCIYYLMMTVLMNELLIPLRGWVGK